MAGVWYTPTEQAPSSSAGSSHWALQEGGLKRRARAAGLSLASAASDSGRSLAETAKLRSKMTAADFIKVFDGANKP
jgi:hypothetical protein